jgi:lipoic acid synthetase
VPENGPAASARRMPRWLLRPVAAPGRNAEVEGMLDELHLNTVCRSAKCPNRGECFASGTATFLIMGDACTRGCRFCAVDTRAPAPLDPDEPARVGEAAKRMGLKHVVVTTVTRDDLPDGGAAHFVAVIDTIRDAAPDARVEVLTSDFGGRMDSVDTVAAARPHVFNHNVETVPRLYAEVRPGADYRRSLDVLARVRVTQPDLPTKSGMMVGLGETREEVVEVMRDLRAHGVDIVTIGQYLRPSARHLPVAEFVEPATFEWYAERAREIGFPGVASSPFVRSSYHAGELAQDAARR